MTTNQPLVVTFDLFSALIDSRTGGTAAFDDLAAERGWPVTGRQVYDDWDARNKQAQRDCGSWVPYPELAALALTGSYRALGLAGEPEPDLARVLETLPEWSLWPDVPQTLESLAGRYRIGLLSNVDDALFQRTRAAAYVDHAVALTSERLGAYKPDPRIYLRARETVGELVHVATSARDVRGALEAGLPVVRLRRPGHHLDEAGPRPAHEAAEGAELGALVERARSARVAARRPAEQPRALRPVTRSRLYEQLVERLLALITELDLTAGDRLPPERELATGLGVSRASVRQALVVLEVQGLVEVRHGEGAVLLDVPRDSRVLSALRAHTRRLPEVIEAREALEVKLAALAATRRTDEDLLRIEAALDRMQEEVVQGGRGLEGDELFHAAVTAAARSGLLADLMAAISGAIDESRLESLSQPDRPARSLASHRTIADAIRAGDAEVAAQAMAEHIRLVSDVALLRGDA